MTLLRRIRNYQIKYGNLTIRFIAMRRKQVIKIMVINTF